MISSNNLFSNKIFGFLFSIYSLKVIIIFLIDYLPPNNLPSQFFLAGACLVGAGKLLI
jgi:hypothetical protein